MEENKEMILRFAWAELLLSAAGGILFAYNTIDLYIHGTLAALMIVVTIPLTVFSLFLCFLSMKIIKFDNSCRIKIIRTHISVIFVCVSICVPCAFLGIMSLLFGPREPLFLIFTAILGAIILFFTRFNSLLSSPEAERLFK